MNLGDTLTLYPIQRIFPRAFLLMCLMDLPREDKINTERAWGANSVSEVPAMQAQGPKVSIFWSKQTGGTN